MKYFFSILFLLASLSLLAQRQTKASRSELGVMYGGMYYIGDLNQYEHFKNTKPAIGLMYRFNVHSRMTLRGNIMYGGVAADDAESDEALLRNRNLHFRSEIWEAAAGVEFNYRPFQIGHPRYMATSYFLVELGAFHFNPQAQFNGYWYNLQALGTEGQVAEGGRSPYLRTQVVMPIGLGFRVTLGDVASLNIEYGIRKTFTDYLDDVRSENYADVDGIRENSGYVAAQLSNRSLDGNAFGRRGDATTKDWYAFAGMMLTFKLGKPKKCFFEAY